jgi:hypothetical protein
MDAARFNPQLKFIYIGGESAETNIDRMPLIKKRTKVHDWRFDYQEPALTQISGLQNDISNWAPSG